jgi:hypothetical protein
MPSNEKAAQIDYAHLLKLRLVVARVGEMDNARWWNTNGLLGQLGTLALKRGFSKTYAFAQARAVFAVASHRCVQVFDPPGGVTVWKLPATIEDQFDSQWSKWTERYQEWDGFFEAIRGLRQTDLLAALLSLGVIQESDAAEARKLRRAADNRAVPIPGVRAISDETLSLLAAGFFRGEPGQPAIPYAKIED